MEGDGTVCLPRQYHSAPARAGTQEAVMEVSPLSLSLGSCFQARACPPAHPEKKINIFNVILSGTPFSLGCEQTLPRYAFQMNSKGES